MRANVAKISSLGTQSTPLASSKCNASLIVASVTTTFFLSTRAWFEDPDYPDKVYKVVKALYGLHQAPRAWYETLATYLLENGFHRGHIDQTLFIKKQNGDILLVQIYVDDIIFGSTNKDLCKSFEKLVKDKFQMSSMGELTFFLGLQVKQKEDVIFINQDKYVAKILKKFGLTKGKSASTPIDTEKPLLKDPDGEDVDVHIYRSMIGSLMYLTSSRPDIMFTVCACPRFKKSTTGGFYFLGSRLISWQCKKQTVIATSSTEAEYVAGASCCAQVLWIHNQMLDYSHIAFALTVNPSIYVSCIKQFWNTVLVKQSNDVTRLQALVDKKKVVVTEATIRDALHLDDAEGIDCLPNEEIFATLARMGYEKPSTKLTVGKGCSGVETPLFEGMLVAREPENQGNAGEQGGTRSRDSKAKIQSEKLERENKVKTVKLKRLRKVGTSQRIDSSADTIMEDMFNQKRMTEESDKDEGDKVVNEQEKTKEVRDNAADAQVKGRQTDIYHIDMDHAAKVLSMQEDEPEIQEAVEVVITAKLITKVIVVVSEIVSDAAVVQADIPTAPVNAAAVLTTAALVKVAVLSTRRRKGVVIRDPKEESST
nr:hypothetical protein [Tanacetum cinerariifolium]